MRAEDFLQMQFDFWPDLFYSRENLLDYLFGCIGNGFRWEHGELVSYDDERQERYVLKAPVVRAEPSKLAVELHQDHVAMMMRRNEILKSRGKAVREEYSYGSSLSKDFSLLYKIPANIRPDYQALVDEYKGYLKNHGVEF